ncbi:ABC-type lipoprotein export system, ATPase component [Eubacterium ruminantium]|uniref:ABC-type lipoprotein export system, ATPase component n=1 Tax=Eubacterium ruminantium TaxID=42322 RepID=A0A1T4M1A6_9FIRM|nr:MULTISPECIES: ABC transporter ATP-binding protein [Eubacterium]SCW37843.1 ABC-type lipoprotein export system, ATPase component [Eubacterium ruminantium]SDM46123.1 ABC-type lipoprotein export system, ATPase component [Eubacterium ruminantium]SJZ60770.1 ABC-type lipoprotein export system, ATPase component [Eubacterium ruminantium]
MKRKKHKNEKDNLIDTSLFKDENNEGTGEDESLNDEYGNVTGMDDSADDESNDITDSDDSLGTTNPNKSVDAEESGKSKEDNTPKDKDYIVQCDGLVKLYKTNEVEAMALQGLELNIERGELIAIIGKSGSGKSTLLNIIGALEQPSAGKIIIDGEDLSLMSRKELEKLRRKKIGFIWQKSSQNLFPYMTAVENVESQLYYQKMSKAERRKKALELLDEVGLKDKADSFPREMSGGEQQRVTIAAALIKDPEILLADEPTGAVDTKTSDMIQNLFRKLNQERGITVIIVTHDISLANKVNRVVMISDGRVTTEKVMKEKYQKSISSLDSETFDMSLVHEEYSVLDKAGRLKLSDEIREQTGITSTRVKVEVVDGKVVISSIDD